MAMRRLRPPRGAAQLRRHRQDRKVEIVGAKDYADVRFALDEANERIAALESLVKRLSRITPREGAWKQCFLALQAAARRLCAANARPEA